MDPLTPTTSTLSPAISHIAETAASLASSIQERTPQQNSDFHSKESQELSSKKEQQETVRWALAAPSRIRQFFDTGRGAEALQDWNEISMLLQTWQGVSGVEELKEECLKILEENRTNDSARLGIDS